jgi:hypothetical protein
LRWCLRLRKKARRKEFLFVIFVLGERIRCSSCPFFIFLLLQLLFFSLFCYAFILLVFLPRRIWSMTPFSFCISFFYFYLFRVLSWYATPFALKKTQVLTFKLIFVSFILIKLA